MLAGDLKLAALVVDLQEQASVLDCEGGLDSESSPTVGVTRLSTAPTSSRK